jgi:hypothetical protein
MNVRSVLIALGACLVLCRSPHRFDWSFQKALILSPIIVMVAGAAGRRSGAESPEGIRSRRHQQPPPRPAASEPGGEAAASASVRSRAYLRLSMAEAT